MKKLQTFIGYPMGRIQDQRLCSNSGCNRNSPTGTSLDNCHEKKKEELAWSGHVTRRAGIPKTVLQRTLRGSRKRGRQTETWMDNVRVAEDRPTWCILPNKSSNTSLLRPSRVWDGASERVSYNATNMSTTYL